ncbi:MAG: S1 RNA-binding domain-containing protein, partial [Firmicutes bacterium]|nr:S1 RNA-binding domain-containing protein [Bacillota bacterium]
DELSVGEEVNTKILEIDKERRRISLSIKETMTAEEEEAMKAAKTEEATAEEAAPAEEPAAEEAPAEEAPAAEEE